MPNTTIQTGQDWGAVNVGRSSANRVNVPKSAAGVSRMKAMGLVATEKKYGAGGNASAHSGAGVNARKIEESDELKHNKVDKKLSVAIQQARMAKKMTQKDLGKWLCVVRISCSYYFVVGMQIFSVFSWIISSSFIPCDHLTISY